ncbi:Guanine nucleotide-binding protein subunit beta-1 [Corchorus olitorius]|uniref:Guanine nucleotide-binding protein subunit beta-1 n=1 Tax=Corchorus olitorius TaxID=93759 RepID=A0A1R3G743_9ROSI|nr:Guanine nucleotide-binding protein subunit beta-1 [Corchorus olitorius]
MSRYLVGENGKEVSREIDSVESEEKLDTLCVKTNEGEEGERMNLQWSVERMRIVSEGSRGRFQVLKDKPKERMSSWQKGGKFLSSLPKDRFITSMDKLNGSLLLQDRDPPQPAMLPQLIWSHFLSHRLCSTNFLNESVPALMAVKTNKCSCFNFAALI